MSSSPPPPNHDPDMDIPSSEMDPEEAPTEPRRKPNVQDAPGTHEQITFQFCRECSNMLYPKEDRMLNKLVYACRTCEFSEDAAAACVYRHDLSNTVGETAGVTQDVAADPTLPRSEKPCPKCSGTQAVYFQSQQRSAETGMKLFYVCVACGNIFQ